MFCTVFLFLTGLHFNALRLNNRHNLRLIWFGWIGMVWLITRGPGCCSPPEQEKEQDPAYKNALLSLSLEWIAKSLKIQLQMTAKHGQR
jgi:hypothetical protein